MKCLSLRVLSLLMTENYMYPANFPLPFSRFDLIGRENALNRSVDRWYNESDTDGNRTV